MVSLFTILSVAAMLLFADAANQPVSMTTIPVEPQVKKLNLNEVEQGIIAGTNAQRARYGLPALQIDPALQQQARGHAAWMTNHQTMQHTSAAVGENIAMGQPSAPDVVAAWMNSSGHRANILNGGYHKIGAAAYTAPNGTIYWCEQFVP